MTSSATGQGTRTGGVGPVAVVSIAALLATSMAAAAPLAAQDPIPLDTLRVVVGSRASAGLPILTRSVQLLGRADIDGLPVRTLSELLGWATGVDVQPRSPAQSDLSIRGAGFEQVVVLVNGVRVSDPQTGHFDLDLAVALDQVERVEVLRGPASALYGADAMGGVVNVVTRSGSAPRRASLEGGSWGTARLSVGGGVVADGGASLQAGAQVARSDGHRPGTDYETLLLHATATRPLARGSLSAELGASRRNFGAKDFYAPFPSFERTRSYDASLRFVGPSEGTLQMESGLSIRRHDDDFVLVRDDPSIYRNEHTSYQGGGVVVGRVSADGGRMQLAVGGELYQDVLRSTSLGDRDEARAAAFAEVVAGRGSRAVLSAGLRADWHETFGSFVSPSLSASVRVSPRVQLRGAAGRSFRAPTWTERYYEDPANVGSADLDPERAWSGEVGVDLAVGAPAGPPVRLALTAFVRRATSLIDWARADDAGQGVPWETRNVEEATFRGVEVDAEVQGPLDVRGTVGASLLSVDSGEVEGYVSKYALRPLTERFVVGLQRSLGGRITLGVHGQRGKRPGEAAYHRVDARARARVGPGWLSVDGMNLADARYPDVTGADAPGRSVSVGFEVGGE